VAISAAILGVSGRSAKGRSPPETPGLGQCQLSAAGVAPVPVIVAAADQRPECQQVDFGVFSVDQVAARDRPRLPGLDAGAERFA